MFIQIEVILKEKLKSKIKKGSLIEMSEDKIDWTTVSFPKEFLESIDKILKDPYIKANYPMSSRGEFLRKAGSELLQRLKKETEENI